MKKTVALMDKFICLAGGEALPASSLKGDWIEQMVADGVLLIVSNGSRKRVRAIDGQAFREHLSKNTISGIWNSIVSCCCRTIRTGRFRWL